MTTAVSAITAVFTAIMGWISEAITTLTPMFYVAETGLTFLGTLTIMGLGISIFFLLVGVISNFLKFRS